MQSLSPRFTSTSLPEQDLSWRLTQPDTFHVYITRKSSSCGNTATFLLSSLIWIQTCMHSPYIQLLMFSVAVVFSFMEEMTPHLILQFVATTNCSLIALGMLEYSCFLLKVYSQKNLSLICRYTLQSQILFVACIKWLFSYSALSHLFLDRFCGQLLIFWSKFTSLLNLHI